MDIDSTGDGTCLDPELLHLSELSPFALKTSPQLAENLFSQWLSLPETGRLVKFISIPNFFFFWSCFCGDYYYLFCIQ